MIKEKSFVSVVVYIYNNENIIKDFLHQFVNYFDEKFEKYEIVLVNDASNDKTGIIIKDFFKESTSNCMVNLINLSYYHGREAAMCAGCDLAIGDFIYEFDEMEIDYEMDVIQSVFYKALEGYDIVSAFSNSDINLASKLFYKIYNKSTSGGECVGRETFRLMSRRAYNRIKMMSVQIIYRKSQYANCGLPITSLQYDSNKSISKRNYSKFEKKYRVEKAVDTLILYTDIATKFMMSLSLLFLLFALGVGIYTISVYIINKPVEGWAPIMGVLSVGLSGLFCILLIVIRYLSLILKTVFSKAIYMISSIEKITK